MQKFPRVKITCGHCARRNPLARANENFTRKHGTTTPIKYVIVVIDENRGFDHVIATYTGDDATRQNHMITLVSQIITSSMLH